jgi:hypothetical protein
MDFEEAGEKRKMQLPSLRNGEKRHIIMQRSTKRGKKGGITKD